jgi:hypothetical protein
MTDDDLPRVELRVRDSANTAIGDRPQTIYERLVRLRDDGKIDGVDAEIWGKQVRARTPTNPTDEIRSARAREKYEELESWAKRNGHDLEPAFSTHTVGSLVDTGRETVIRFPVICLAVYDADDLLTVAPCTTEDGVRSVDDCLDMLRSETEARDAAEPSGMNRGG